MMNKTRRSLLVKGLSGISLVAADTSLGLSSGILGSVYAQTSAGFLKSIAQGPLIIVFQRGGADGLSILSPLDDENFNAARPPDMRFSKHSASGQVNLGSTKLYWHPHADSLARLYDQRKLIAWPAVGLTNQTRSHFEAQEMLERGVSSLSKLPDPLGWLTRLANKSGNSAELPLFAGSTTLPRSMQGSHHALAIRDLQAGVNIPNGETGQAAFSALCDSDNFHVAAKNMSMHARQIADLNRILPKTSDNKIQAYQSKGEIAYPNSDPGVGLRSVARIIESKVGLQYAWVDQNGWDTHDSQPGRLNNVVANLGQALEAFAQDMQARQQTYTLMVMTEFGRRLRSNRSNGTDHGHASLALVMGDRIPGGQVFGTWPGLDNDALDRSVDLAVTTDYQKLISQVMQWHLNA